MGKVDLVYLDKERSVIKVKDTKEIATRAIITLCLSDRCALEKTIIGGKVYSIKQREEQRKAIFQWLTDKGYSQSITANEKTLFEQEIGVGNKEEIVSNQVQYEAIEPYLWTLGLVNKLSRYDEFVLNDFHQVLQIGLNHSLEHLMTSFDFRKIDDVILQREISMLWHWRANEASNPIFRSRPVREIILSTFGKDYELVVDKIQKLNRGQHDLIVNNKLFNELNFKEKKRVNLIAYWRHYAFEWITGNESWEDVTLDT